ncbi:MAG: hypothetical protein O7E57_07410 [Gammaproteobacteria bacterium]|nr:hypothetical protein [Gammaproteobacteria bacterium]
MLNRRNLLAWGACSTWLGGVRAGIREHPLESSTMRQRIERDIRAWDAIAEHRTGTAGASRTAAWLAAEIRACGLEPKIDRFPFERRVLHVCSFEAGAHRADGVPLFDGGYTDSNGVSGVLGSLGSRAAIGLTEFSPTPRGNVSLDAARRKSTHSAIIAVARGDAVRPGLSLLNADAYRTPYGPPVLQVATKHRDWLQTTRANGVVATLIAHSTLEATQAGNVQVTIPGRNPALAPLVIMTPLSAWWTCTSERAGGITIWLECIRLFTANRPHRDLIFTANTGHELGHVGLDHYLQQNPTLVRDAHAWIHLGANFAARNGGIRFQTSNDRYQTRGLRAFDKQNVVIADVTPPGQRPYGEARNIYDGDGQYISLLGGNSLFHHPDDRWPEAVDLDKTHQVTKAMLDIVTQLSRA